MKLLAICSSPRPNGNSIQLTEAALAGARATGAETERVDINRLKLRGCQADLACKQDGRCRVKDDMQPLYSKIEQADAILLASPIYVFTVNAQMKTLLDRLYTFMRPDLTTRLQPGKRSALIVTQGWPNEAENLPYLSAVPRASSRPASVLPSFSWAPPSVPPVTSPNNRSCSSAPARSGIGWLRRRERCHRLASEVKATRPRSCVLSFEHPSAISDVNQA